MSYNSDNERGKHLLWFSSLKILPNSKIKVLMLNSHHGDLETEEIQEFFLITPVCMRLHYKACFNVHM